MVGPRKLNTDRLCDRTTPFPGTYPTELTARTWTDFQTPVFTVALLTIAKRQIHKHPLMDEPISRMWSRHATEYD